MPGSNHDVVEYSAERLIAALDDSPLGPARALDEGQEEPGQVGYRRLASAVLHQLCRDMTVAARKDLQGTLRYLSWLSAREDTFGVWCQALGLDTEQWIDTLIERLTAKCMFHGEGAAAD